MATVYETTVSELGDLRETVERMRKVGEDEAREDRAEGKRLGIAWAKDQATPGQLRRLKVRRESDGPTLLYHESEGSVAHSVVNTVRDQSLWLAANACGYRDDPNELSDAFVIGFANGALEVWAAVEGQL